MDARQRGMWGEELALEHLKRKHFTMVARGFRSRFGEIDIIAKNRDYIVFVEVKLRKDAHFAYAREFVSKSKQNKIKTTARLWLSMNDTDLQPRFDVIEVYARDKQATPEIVHIENAF